MNENRLKDLLSKYKKNACTDTELEELDEWYHSLNFKDEHFNAWTSDKRRFYTAFQQRVSRSNRVRTIHRFTRYAAAVFVVLLGVLWLVNHNEKQIDRTASLEQLNYIEPGGDKAFLTLENGVKIALNDMGSGTIVNQSGIKITKTQDGQLIYEIVDADEGSEEISFNTIETPKGGQYQLILPDKSHVWLNAASSLRYPTRFNGKERRVELKGEAYFEIARNEDKPFKVETHNQVVEVLGTHFNINSYEDEPETRTTLVEGLVKVSKRFSNESTLLAPGEQTILSPGGLNKVQNANLDEATAWKNMLFQFENVEIDVLMRQISRWYDVAIEYEGAVPQVRLTGKIHRNTTDASKIFSILSYFNIKYRLERLSDASQRKKIVIINNL